MPQFRTLAVIDRNANASLSDVTEHIGLTLPSMSKLVDGLVARKLATLTDTERATVVKAMEALRTSFSLE
jgi:hypothetical protein